MSKLLISKVSENIPDINHISQPSTVPKSDRLLLAKALGQPVAYKVRRSCRMTLLKREMYIHTHGSTHVCTQAHIHGRSSHSSMFPWTYPLGKQHTSGSCSSILQSTPSSEGSFTCYLIMHLPRLLPSVVWWLRGKFVLLYTLAVV